MNSSGAQTKVWASVFWEMTPGTSVLTRGGLPPCLEKVAIAPGVHRDRANGTLRAVVYAGIDPLAEKPRYLNDPDQAETVLTRLLICRTPCVGRKTGHQCDPLAANTIRKIHFIFQGALKRAVKWKYVATNEAELAEPPAFEQSEPDPPPGQEAAAIRSGEPSRGPRW